MENFELDPRIHADTYFAGELALSQLLLMNDSRWPWVILVPKIAGMTEIHELDYQKRLLLSEETNAASRAMKALTNCKKINIGSLGNVVSQLHVHVLARNEGDPNWPSPVWGFDQRIAYEDKTAIDFANSIFQQTLKELNL